MERGAFVSQLFSFTVTALYSPKREEGVENRYLRLRQPEARKDRKETTEKKREKRVGDVCVCVCV